MGLFSLRRVAIGSIVGVTFVVVSCVRTRPPQVKPSSSLNTGDRGNGPRRQGPFAVVYAGPREKVAARDQGTVTVLFNRAMRSFEAADTAGLPSLAVRTDQGQSVAGAWRFVGTHGLLFTPRAALPGSTRFMVTVAAGARSLGGDELKSDYTFSFFTATPEVTSATPANGAGDVRAGAFFQLNYNQRMNPEAVAAKARLSARARPGDKPKNIAVRGAHPKPAGGLTPEASEEIVVLTPAETLPLDNEIQLVVDPGLTGADGPLATKVPFTLDARTYGPLRLADFRCPKVDQGRCQAHRDVTVVLSNDVAPAEFRAHFKAPALPRQKVADAKKQTPAEENSPSARAARAEASKPRREHLLAADPEMGKRYRITLTRGMRDVFGQVLARDVAFDIDTEAPFVTADGKRVVDPNAATAATTGAESAPPPSDEASEGEGEEASYPDQTVAEKNDPRPRRARLAYELALGVQGHVVEAVGKDGKRPHLVPIGAVNVPTYGMIASKMRQEDAVVWLGAAPRAFDPLRWTWVSPGVTENTRSVRTVDLDTLVGGAGGHGAALLAVAWPGNPGSSHQSELVTVTDIGMSAAMSTYGSLVWVTRLSTGRPLPAATVSVRRTGAKGEVFRGTTDAEGLVVIPKQQYDPVKNGSVDGEAFLFANAGDDWTYQRVERALASHRSPVGVDLQQRGAWAGMLYTDRGVYRPGESLKLAGIFRKFDAAGMKTPLGAEARIQITDSQGEHVFDGRARLDGFGGIAIDVPLPRTAHLGDASVGASMGGVGSPSFSTSILLAEYKASEFKVAVDPGKSEYVRGDEASFDVHAEYLFGAPMGNVPLHTRAERSGTGFVPPGADAFTVTDEAGVIGAVETNPHAEELSETDDTLDDSGVRRRTLKLDLPRMAGPEQVTLEADVRDLTNQTVARRATVLVHPASFYLGLKRLERRFLAVGADVPANLVAFDPSGKHVPGVAAKVELMLRTWVGVVEDDPAEAARRRSKAKDEVVGTCDVVTTAAAASCKLKVQKPGYYLLRATATDGRRNAVGASTSFYAVDDRADETTTAVAFRNPEARGVELEADKKEYKTGENARILVRSPFREADALVTVQRGGVLWHQVVAVKGPMPVVEVPVRSEYFPNVFVSVHLVRGRIKAAPENGVDLGAPDFRVGTTELKVDPNTHRLDVRIAPLRAEYRPGEAVDADVTVIGAEGRPARASLTFYAVDEGVLMLTGYKTPDPLPAFATQRKLAVFGLESRESLARILSMKSGEKIARLGFDFLSLGSEDKGSDGGGGGEDAVRADFKTTAFFEAGRVTSNEGKAHFHFKLPDNLTTFRLMAIASAEDDRFGFGESRITTNRKLMARPALPRLVRVGDEFQAGVVVSSRDLPDSVVDVALRAKGLTADGPAARRIQLGRGKSVEVRFPVKATASGPASLEFDVRGSGHEDKVLVKRDVELPVSHETIAVYGETSSAAAVALGDLRGMRTDTGGLDIHLASTALAGIGESFERNLEYPYGCTEQLVSRALPLLLLTDLGRAFHARLPAKTDDVIDDAVGEILNHQTGSGGFGYWEGDYVDVPWLSAFAMLALEAAAEKGHFVPKAARDQGIAYLQGVISGAHFAQPATTEDDDQAPSDDTVPDEKKPERDYADVAFAADVLATVGQAQPGTLNLLFDARRDKPLFSQALLLHAMAVAKLPANTLEIMSRELVSRLRVGAAEAFADEATGEYDYWLDSSVRTTALALRALLAVNPKHPLAARLARGLLARREHGAWRSTQENTWALLALDDYRKKQESALPNFDAQVFLGDELVGSAAFHGRSTVDAPFSLPAARVVRNPGALSFSVAGEGKLFYAAELRYASSKLPSRPDDAGFSVQRLVRALKPKELAEAQKTVPQGTQASASVNDLVMIDVLFESAEPREQIVLDDPLPAGLEPIDFALETSARQQQVSESPAVANQPEALGTLGYGAFRAVQGMHREMHDDRVLTFLPHVEPGIYHFRYLARATTPGRFVVPPLRTECMYSPEVNGRTAASTFEVLPAATAKAGAGKVAVAAR